MDMEVIVVLFWFAAWQTASCLFATPASTCEDLDSAACKIFQKADLEMCEKPEFGEKSCKRYCGNCPIECYTCPEAMANPQDCNVTAPCGHKEICMYKHAIVGGQSRHMFTCERREICEGLTMGFGKRSARNSDLQDGIAIDRMERDVAVKCCASDYCNSPFSTATTTDTVSSITPVATTNTPLTASNTVTTQVVTTVGVTADPSVCYKDIVFVLDDSGSVTRHTFGQELDFVTRVVSQINVGLHHAHVSLLAYSNRPEIQWYLDAYITRHDVLSAINRVPYIGGVASISKALDAVRKDILDVNNGDRRTAGNAVVVLTNGITSENQAVLNHSASALHSVSKDVMTIGIGHGMHQPVMDAIATDHKHVAHIRDQNHLPNLVQRVVNIICS